MSNLWFQGIRMFRFEQVLGEMRDATCPQISQSVIYSERVVFGDVMVIEMAIGAKVRGLEAGREQ
jgi:hypothetical protein